jgi:hypothetical protein
MSKLNGEESTRLAALELIVSELLVHCASNNPQAVVDILRDTHNAMMQSTIESKDHAVFSTVAREYELAIERCQIDTKLYRGG